MAEPRFRELDDADLLEQLGETKDELLRLRFQHATGQLSNHARIGQARKNLARIHTELRAREIAAAEAMNQENG